MTYVAGAFLFLMFLLYVWSNFVVRNVRCPLCDVDAKTVDRVFGPVHVCAHLKVEEDSRADL